MVHLNQTSSCRMWQLTLCWVRFCQINKSEFCISLIHFCSMQKVKRKYHLYILHGDTVFLFYFYICIKFTLSIIISMMKKCQSHLKWCVSCVIKAFFMIKITINCLREKKNDRKTLTKLAPQKNYFISAKFRY